ncbi:carbon-nitrogen hydrolase family protein [Paradesulfitobacterium aromaticivorans]
MLVAVAQIDIAFKDKRSNLAKCLSYLRLAAHHGAKIVVFPECTLTGYCFSSYEEALSVSEEVPGESSQRLIEACRDHRISAVVGLLERSKDKIYNTSLLITPEGLVGKYRKTHLLCLGVDRYTSSGNDLPVFETPLGRMGMLICYDQRFPEPARALALQGAQVILNPMNLPTGAEAYPNHLFQSRACENRAFIVAANRVGVENGVRFIGRSQIINIFGQVLAEGDNVAENLITAEIIPSQADEKHVINRPGEYEFDIVADRRPELYKVITKKK